MGLGPEMRRSQRDLHNNRLSTTLFQYLPRIPEQQQHQQQRTFPFLRISFHGKLYSSGYLWGPRRGRDRGEGGEYLAASSSVSLRLKGGKLRCRRPLVSTRMEMFGKLQTNISPPGCHSRNTNTHPPPAAVPVPVRPDETEE